MPNRIADFLTIKEALASQLMASLFKMGKQIGVVPFTIFMGLGQ